MVKKQIIIIDDELLMSTLIQELIDGDSDFEISKITTKKKEFLDAVTQGRSFDVALIDISVDGREGGIELLKFLKSNEIPLPVVIFSAHDEMLYAPCCLELGARGYITKDHICSDLTIGLKEVLDGNLFVSGEKGKNIVKTFHNSYGNNINP